MKVPNKQAMDLAEKISLSRLQNEGSQPVEKALLEVGKSIKATE